MSSGPSGSPVFYVGGVGVQYPFDGSYRAIPAGGPVSAIDGTGTVTPDASLGNMFSTIVTGNLILLGPTNPTDGQKVLFRLKQDSMGHSVTFSTGFRFGTDIPTFTASGANLTDYVGAVYNGPAMLWDVVATNRGF